MADDRDKLLRIMDSLESDYKSGKISAEKYSYFRSKYEDKLNTIDARAATKRIRSMQGKSSSSTKKSKKNKKSKIDKKKEEEDLVQKYIINPKKDDAKYNKKTRFSMDSSTFKLFLLLILVIAFTAGVAYGIFGCEFDEVVETNSGVVVLDTAFPDITEDTTVTTAASNSSSYTSYSSDSSYDSSYDDSSDSSSYSSSSQSSSYSSSDYSSSEDSSQYSQSSSYDSGPTADSQESASYESGSNQ